MTASRGQHGFTARILMDDAEWVSSGIDKHRERLIEHDAVIELFNEVQSRAAIVEMLLPELETPRRNFAMLLWTDEGRHRPNEATMSFSGMSSVTCFRVHCPRDEIEN